MPCGKEEGQANALHSDFMGIDGGRESGDMKGGQVCLAASQREGLIGKGGTRRKYSKR